MKTEAAKTDAPKASAGDTLRHKLEVIIFGTSTRAGRNFDITLLVLILASVVVVMIDSVPHIHAAYEDIFWKCEIF